MPSAREIGHDLHEQSVSTESKLMHPSTISVSPRRSSARGINRAASDVRPVALNAHMPCTGKTSWKCMHAPLETRHHTDEARAEKQRREMAALLKTMRSYATAEDKIKIATLIEVEEEDERLDLHQESSSQYSPDTRAASAAHSHIGQRPNHGMGCLAVLNENLYANDQTREVGFLGMSSAVQWLRLVAEVRARAQPPDTGDLCLGIDPLVSPNVQSGSFCYWMNSGSEDEGIGSTGIDAQKLPPFEIAQKLLTCYKLDVDDNFPILSCKNFERQFRKYYAALHQGNAPKLSLKWQANLNLVFAIGTIKLLRSTSDSHIEDLRHCVYRARAVALNLQSADVAGPIDVPLVQSYGLLAFYYLCAGQVNRAWMISGTALRSAISLGLHLRNEDPCATETKRERLVRIWWSLYSLESLLSSITGRPSTIAHVHCTIPLPKSEVEERISQSLESRNGDYNEDIHTMDSFDVLESTSGLYFQALIQLGVITQDMLVTLYSAPAATKSLGQIEREIAQLHQRLDQWLDRLPASLNYWHPTTNISDWFARERILLGSQLSYVRMLLTLPCLNAFVQGWFPISEHKATFTERMSIACLDAARATVDFLPNEPHLAFVFDQHSWWCLVHHLMQAASVLLLGLECIFPEQNKSLQLCYLNKISLWLQAMDDQVAKQAEQVLEKLLGSREVQRNPYLFKAQAFELSAGICARSCAIAED